MCEEQIKEAVARRDAQWLSCLPERKSINDDVWDWNDCLDEFDANAKKLKLID